MKLHDYHNALSSKLLCFTEGTELLEGCVLETGYKIFKDTQLKHNLRPTINHNILFCYRAPKLLFPWAFLIKIYDEK